MYLYGSLGRTGRVYRVLRGEECEGQDGSPEEDELSSGLGIFECVSLPGRGSRYRLGVANSGHCIRIGGGCGDRDRW